MVKLIYNGVMALGRYKSKNFEKVVKKGETYDIPTSDVDECLKGGEWKKVEKKSKFNEKAKKDLTIVDEDIEEDFSDTKKEKKSNYGGNKKW